MNKYENILCKDCEHYNKPEYFNGDCKYSRPDNPDYCQYKPKKEKDK